LSSIVESLVWESVLRDVCAVVGDDLHKTPMVVDGGANIGERMSAKLIPNLATFPI
jgi:hypothetical protein